MQASRYVALKARYAASAMGYPGGVGECRICQEERW